MPNRLRRFEILLPLQFNDGREIPPELVADATLELVDHFGAVSYETQTVEGHWSYQGTLYRDSLVKLIVDIQDNKANRTWMREFKQRWRDRLEQIDLWLVSYEIEVE